MVGDIPDMVELRCKYCGAPLPADDVKSDAPYITCPSCGTTQQKIDAKEYLAQMMGQVRSWVNKAIPGGMAVANSTSVDSVARYNIFMTSVKPKVEQEFGNYKFGLVSMLSHTMMVMPFAVDTTLNPAHKSEDAFSFCEKLNQVRPLAVDPETIGIMQEYTGATNAYAVLINNSKLLKEDKPGRYVIMCNNFTSAADDFSRIEGYQPAADRFTALATMATGCDQLINGDFPSAISNFEAAKKKLLECQSKLFGNLKVAIMGQAVKMEIKQCDTLNNLCTYVNSMGGTREVFDAISKIFSFQYPSSGEWAFFFKNDGRLLEILEDMSAVVKARSGVGTLPITSGDGDILVPYWHVAMNYSFQTGAMWKKKAVEVHEDLLVAADFTADPGCLNDPRSAVTDIFSVKAKNGMFAGLTGSETSISSGEGMGQIYKSAAPNGTSGRKVVIPLSTKKEAEHLVEKYVAIVAAGEDKLKLSNPDVDGLVYVPYRINGNSLDVSGHSNLVPARTRRADLSKLIIL
ncbi:hypothetical protein TALC_01484 [Thermoplasmatales archaeon BRNA1]|nr:hypothetical protein TALC_01484 [Thermoplasmatales archaeon BRNA1]